MTQFAAESTQRPTSVFVDGRHHRSTGRARGALAEYRCLEGGEDRRVWADAAGRVEMTSPGAYKVGDKVATGGDEEEGVVEEVLENGRFVVVKWEDGSRSRSPTNSLVPSAFSASDIASRGAAAFKVGDEVLHVKTGVRGKVTRVDHHGVSIREPQGRDEITDDPDKFRKFFAGAAAREFVQFGKFPVGTQVKQRDEYSGKMRTGKVVSSKTAAMVVRWDDGEEDLIEDVDAAGVRKMDGASAREFAEDRGPVVEMATDTEGRAIRTGDTVFVDGPGGRGRERLRVIEVQGDMLLVKNERDEQARVPANEVSKMDGAVRASAMGPSRRS